MGCSRLLVSEYGLPLQLISVLRILYADIAACTDDMILIFEACALPCSWIYQIMPSDVRHLMCKRHVYPTEHIQAWRLWHIQSSSLCSP